MERAALLQLLLDPLVGILFSAFSAEIEIELKNRQPGLCYEVVLNVGIVLPEPGVNLSPAGSTFPATFAFINPQQGPFFIRTGKSKTIPAHTHIFLYPRPPFAQRPVISSLGQGLLCVWPEINSPT